MPGYLRRRRECKACGARFTTAQQFDKPEIVVVPDSGMVRSRCVDGLKDAAIAARGQARG